MADAFKVGALWVRPHVRGGVRSGAWQVDVPPHLTLTGKRQRPSFPSREAAEDGARAILMDVRRKGAAGRLPPSDIAPSPTLRLAVQQWFERQKVRVEARKKKASSLETNLYQLKPILDVMGALTLDRLTASHLEDYQAIRTRAGCQPETVNSEIATLTQVQRWAVTEGLMPRVIETDRIAVEPKEPVILDPDEAICIIQHLPDRLRPFVLFLMETGCRSGEARNLQWRHVDLEAGVAQIARREDWTPKTKHSVRKLRLSPDLCDELRVIRRDGALYVFEGRIAGKPLDNMRRSFASAVRQAGIIREGEAAKVRPKDLRAFYATWQAREGVRERVLQSLLGHAPGSRVTKRHYEFGSLPEEEAAARGQWRRLGRAGDVA